MTNPLASATNKISDLNNPFESKYLKEFATHCYQSFDGWRYSGRIEFLNGNTTGMQRFQADSYGGLLLKMQAFMRELETSGE